jgi:hypothetical protein
MTEAEALLSSCLFLSICQLKLRAYLLESIAQAANEIKEIDMLLLNSEVQECQ